MSEDIDNNHHLIYTNIITSDFSVLEQADFWAKVSTDLPGYWDVKKEKKRLKRISFNQFIYEPHKIRFLIYKLKERFDLKNRYKG